MLRMRGSGDAMVDSPQLFIGSVKHCRFRPVTNSFCYPVFYMQLPLRNLAAASNAVFSLGRFNVLQFNESDHGPCDGSALLPWVQTLLRERGLPDDGEITLQCFPRVFGYVFNPISFWLCRNRVGELIAVLAEVRNTFGGQHSYLLHNPKGSPIQEGQELSTEKAFHVSPFCKVEGCYRFRFYLDRPGPRIAIDYHDAEGLLLATSMSGESTNWSSRALLGAVLKMPLLTVGVMLRIHWQALKLWRKGVTFYGANPPANSSSGNQRTEP